MKFYKLTDPTNRSYDRNYHNKILRENYTSSENHHIVAYLVDKYPLDWIEVEVDFKFGR